VILVHGEANEMGRLKAALTREYDADPNTKIEFHSPRNTVAVELFFRGEKMAKVVGRLAEAPPVDGEKVSGILVKRNFNYHLMHPDDLQKYTDMTMSKVTQRQSVYYSGSFQLLQFMVSQLAGDIEVVPDRDKKIIRAFGAIDVIFEKQKFVILEWEASPINDMYADAVLMAVLQAENIETPRYIPSVAQVDKTYLKECVIEMLQEMFGENSVGVFVGDRFDVTVDNKKASVDLGTLKVECPQDLLFQQIVHTACAKLKQSLMPADSAKKI
jgi:cleavage and polyadenylation specificity factor subunit 3